MKQLLITTYLLCLINYNVYALDVLPPPFTAAYELYAKGLPIGKSARQLSFKDGKWIFEGKTHTSGIFALFRDDRIQERSIFKMVEGQIQPLEYIYDHQGSHKQKYVHLTFDWTRNVVKSIRDKVWEISVPKGVLDEQVFQIALMQKLQQGKRELSYQVVDDGKIKTYTPTYLGNEQVKIKLGKFEVLKYQRVSSDQKRKTTLWCAPSLHYLPVQIEHSEKGNVVTMVLLSVSGF